MKRKVISALVLVCILCLILAVPAFAESTAKDVAVVDRADLLSQEEESRLTAKLEQLSQTYKTQIVIATMDTIESSDIDDYIEEAYDSADLGYGETHDGILLLLVMDIREFRILSNGAAADALTLGRIDKITDAITPALSDGDYADAFEEFADQCEYYLNGHINGFPFNFGKNLLIALIIGIVVGLIVASVLKGQLKSVRKQERAHAYVKPDSMQITERNDFFLYRDVKRTKKESSSSSNSRSSGSSRNVGGGSF